MARWRRRSRRTSPRVPASSAASGSSRSSSRGSVASARARATRWAWPPDSAPRPVVGVIGEPDPLEPALGAAARLVLGDAAGAQPEGDVLERASGSGTGGSPGTRRRPVGARVGRRRRRAGSSSDVAVERDATGVDRQEPGEAAEQRGLAGAVGSEDGDGLAVRRRSARRRGRNVPSVRDDLRGERHAARCAARRGTGRAGPTSTPNETAISTRLSTIASSGSTSLREVDGERHRLGAAGEVAGERDRGTELAERPRPRQHGAGDERRAGSPAASRGGTRTSATRRACGRRPRSGVSSWRKAASTVMTRNGMATNVWATTTPVVVNGSVKPNQRSRYWPRRPRRPSEKNRATPPTTGGSTIDSVHSARTSPRPGNDTRASSQASGTPNTTDGDGRPQRAPHREPQRGAGAVGGEDRPGVTPRHPPQQPDERQGEEGDGDAGEDEDQGRQALLPDPAVADGDRGVGRRHVHGAPKPCSARMAWPSAPVRKSMNASSTSGFSRRGDGGDRVLGDDVDVVGDLDHVGGVAGGDDVGDVDDPGVGLAGGDLGDDAADVLLEADRVSRSRRRRRRSGWRSCRTAPRGRR